MIPPPPGQIGEYNLEYDKNFSGSKKIIVEEWYWDIEAAQTESCFTVNNELAIV